LFSNLTLSYLFRGTIGGGLISGVAALAANAINHSVRILAAQPKGGADDSAQSKASGTNITLPSTCKHYC
jgi:serine racemase